LRALCHRVLVGQEREVAAARHPAAHGLRVPQPQPQGPDRGLPGGGQHQALAAVPGDGPAAA
ncbi:unnamed protein product, partial [Heterosigma akashiwo]